jgi:hypothetical protein
MEGSDLLRRDAMLRSAIMNASDAGLDRRDVPVGVFVGLNMFS